MNGHLEAEHLHKCDSITCDQYGFEYCCLKHNGTENVIAYCCDIHDYLDKHIVPPMYDSFTYAIETPPLHYLGPDDGVTTIITHEDQQVPESPIPMHISHPPRQQDALGWTYIGIISGIIALLMFFIVLITIIYVLYRWKNKDRRLRYHAEGHEVVVYNSKPEQVIETVQRQTCPDSCSAPTSTDRYSPPPYSTPERTMSDKDSISTENEKNLKVLPQIN